MSFLEHEVAFHQAVIDALHTTLLPAIKNEELKALVVKVAPAFQAHMLAAQQLEKQLEKQVGSKWRRDCQEPVSRRTSMDAPEARLDLFTKAL
jgi:hypothetical protein